jgi:putative ABC transport system ATP-binding protein
MFSLTGIAHRYGDTTVLRVDEWRADAGEHWLVAGASGSGKTTLLHILAALTTPTRTAPGTRIRSKRNRRRL